jgi:glycosyltransferase involved in cell wall biosynthesis
MSNLMVSISCLVYNHENYLRKCLDGFLMQKTSFSFEILIHDDASTDSSVAIIEEYRLNYPEIVKPIYQVENQFSKGIRPTFAFNIPRAKGKYISLCEGDDYWTDPFKLQKQIEFLEENMEFVMCFHNANNFHQDTGTVDVFAHLETREYSGQEILESWKIPTASIVFRNNIVDLGRISNPKYLYADIILFLSIAEYGKIWAFEDVMSVYRRHIGGVSFGNITIDKVKAFIAHYKQLETDFDLKYTSSAKRGVSHHLMHLSSLELRKGRIKGVVTFLNAIFYMPGYAMQNIKTVYFANFMKKLKRL